MKHTPGRGARYLSVELAHVTLRRGGRRILRDLCWRIRPGERWLLQGANGAGKTQLLKLIAGDIWPEPLAKTRRQYLWRGEASTEPYEVREEIAYLGAERQDRYQHYDWNYTVGAIVGTGIQRSDTPLRSLTRSERLRVARLLRRLGIKGLVRRRFLSLSHGERRLVLLGRALAWRPALLLLDEPLNGLDALHRQRVLKALNALSRSRLPWVYCSHRLEEIPKSVTHWARLENGGLRTGRWASRSRSNVIQVRRRPAVPRRPPQVLIELRDASVWREGRLVLRHLTMQIRSGECWVVHGANGSGKSTFLATIEGALSAAGAGSIWRRFAPPGAPLDQFQERVGSVAPELQASLPRQLTALECVAAGLRGAYELVGRMRLSERDAALGALRTVGARGCAGSRVGELSYGQARRVLFARALARRPDIVLLDEPYTGLDMRTRRRLHALVDTWVRQGRTVVIATHQRGDWPRDSSYELALAAGRPRYCGPLRSGQTGVAPELP